MKCHLIHFTIALVFWHIPQPRWLRKTIEFMKNYKEEG